MKQWLRAFFAAKRTEQVLLIDIGAGSVAGAYTAFPTEGTPTLPFLQRVPIEPKEHENHEAAMLRALTTLCAALVRDGAPALMRATGRGSVDSVLISISAPWQKTTIRHEKFEGTKPFTVTRKMIEKAVEKASVAPPGMLLVDESIVGTLLNGYETQAPYGRKATRAAVVVLASYIKEPVARTIAGIVRAQFHTERLLSIAGSSLRYQALRDVFPHERSSFVIDTSGPEVAVSLVRNGLLVAVTELPDGTPGSEEWVLEIKKTFRDFAVRYPLPRRIFVLADEQFAPQAQAALTNKEITALWLSDEPPTIVMVRASSVTGIQQTTTGTPDLSLLLMALFWKNHGHEE